MHEEKKVQFLICQHRIKTFKQFKSLKSRSMASSSKVCCSIPLEYDCMREILKYVPTKDLLINVINVNEFFRHLVWDVISTRLIHFNALTKYIKAEEIFEEYGRDIRRINISERDTAVEAEGANAIDPAGSFKNFLALIMRCCYPGVLTELHLDYRSTEVDANLLLPALPYFTRLKKLSLRRHGDLFMDAYTFLMARLCAQPQFRPTDLTLHFIRLDRTWARSAQLENLKTIKILGRYSNAFELIDFLRDKTELKSLKYSSTFGHYLPEISAAIRHFHQLEVFSYFDLRFYVSGTVRKEVPIKLSNPSIKHLSIPLYSSDGSDLHLWLDKDSAIETLVIQLRYTDVPHEAESLNNLQAAGLAWLKTWTAESFDRLTSVEIGIWTKTEDPQESRSQSELTFLLKFLTQLKNLKTVTINSSISISDFHTILEYIPNVQSLSFAHLELLQLPVEMEKFAVALSRLKEKRAQQQPIHLAVNQTQYDQLKVIIFFVSKGNVVSIRRTTSICYFQF